MSLMSVTFSIVHSRPSCSVAAFVQSPLRLKIEPFPTLLPRAIPFLTESALAGEITVQDILRHPWPDPEDPGRTRGVREQALELKSRSGTFLGQVLVDLGFVSASALA